MHNRHVRLAAVSNSGVCPELWRTRGMVSARLVVALRPAIQGCFCLEWPPGCPGRRVCDGAVEESFQDGKDGRSVVRHLECHCDREPKGERLLFRGEQLAGTVHSSVDVFFQTNVLDCGLINSLNAILLPSFCLPKILQGHFGFKSRFLSI